MTEGGNEQERWCEREMPGVATMRTMRGGGDARGLTALLNNTTQNRKPNTETTTLYKPRQDTHTQTRAHTDACCSSKGTEALTVHTPGGEHRPLRPDADGVACEQELFETFNAMTPIAQSFGLRSTIPTHEPLCRRAICTLPVWQNAEIPGPRK